MQRKSNILDFEVMRCARDNKISYQTALRVYGDLVFQDAPIRDFEMFCMGRPESDYNERLFTELREQIYDEPSINKAFEERNKNWDAWRNIWKPDDKF